MKRRYRKISNIIMTSFFFLITALEVSAADQQRIIVFGTGRSVQEVLVDAGRNADRENRTLGAFIEKRHLEMAIENHISREDNVEMEFIALTALSLCSLQSLLPWNDSNGLRAGAKIPEKLVGNEIVTSDGKLQKDRLYKAIAEIKRERHTERMMR